MFDGWMAKVEYHGWRCFYCRIELNRSTLTIDHRKALVNGGSNWLANLVPACSPCNKSKGCRAAPKFVGRIGPVEQKSS